MLASLERRYDDSVNEVRMALSLAPGSVDIAAFSAAMLTSADIHDEAILQIEKAIRLSPILPANFLGIQGQVYRLAGRIDDAIAVFKAYSENGAPASDMPISRSSTSRPGAAKTPGRRSQSSAPPGPVSP